jgi:hypothetical protein
MVIGKLQLDRSITDIWKIFMRFQLNTVLVAVLALAATPALAAGRIAGGNALAAPGPIAGAGLGFLVLARGYYSFRRWRKQNSAK